MLCICIPREHSILLFDTSIFWIYRMTFVQNNYDDLLFCTITLAPYI